MEVAEAFVSGSLGQAVYREGGAFRIIDAPQAEAREALPNEVQSFRQAAREVAPAHPDGLPVSIDMVRVRLDEEIRSFTGLDGLLVGMDRDFSEATRARAISRAEDILSVDDPVARRIRQRFLIPANAQEWDPASGLALALRNAAKAAANCYRLLAEGFIDRLADDIGAVVIEKLGSGIDAARAREVVLHSGVLAELALVEARADRAAFSALLFRRSEFPKLQAVDASGQILAAIVRRIEKRTAPASADTPAKRSVSITDDVDESDAFDPTDPIVAAVDRALANFQRRKRRSREGSSADLPGIQREIAWIGERLKFGEKARAEYALTKLIDRQGRRSRAGDVVKTLTAVADVARGAKLFDWTLRLLAVIERVGSPDAAAMNVHAETLRDLGRYDEALVAFEDTMRRFPQNEVAPNARAETLRDLGRYDEALAAFEDTLRRFPQNAVARRAYAHLLGSRGRIAEVKALLAPAAARSRTRGDWIATHILAMARLRAGHVDEALAELERGVRSCAHRDTRGYFERARPLALLAKRRAAEAAQQWEETLAKNPNLPREEITNIILFQAHALAEAGEPRRARTLMESAQVVDFAAARQRLLAAALTEHYGLSSGVPAPATRAQQLSGDIAALEFDLVRPKLWSFRAGIGRAA
jgi:tetratricopeptide (TPR) repeat protein